MRFFNGRNTILHDAAQHSRAKKRDYTEGARFPKSATFFVKKPTKKGILNAKKSTFFDTKNYLCGYERK
jgi:hypothetical protein